MRHLSPKFYCHLYRVLCSPGPVAGLEVLAVYEAPGAGLQQRAPEHAHVVEAAVGGVRVVAELLGTPELSLLAHRHS